MLRLHFTGADLLRTRFAPAPAPLMELSLALMSLRHAGTTGRLRAWQRQTMARVTPRSRPILELTPSPAVSPRFLDPVTEDVDDGIDTVRTVATRTARYELRRVFPTEAPITPWVRALYDRDRTAWQDLGVALLAAYRDLVEVDWPHIEASHRADLAVRSATLTTDGVQAALSGLYPGAFWQDTTLSLPSSRERDCHLEGRGLVLLSSAYWVGDPAVTLHPDGSAVLMYPSVASIPLGDGTADTRSLAELLGRTRAAALLSLTRHRSTSELAAELGLSISAASEQTATLRRSGLITTERTGRSVRHQCTPLGLRLIAGY